MKGLGFSVFRSGLRRVLPPPWLWRGGQAYSVALRHRGRGALAPPTHSRWAAYALSLGFRGWELRVSALHPGFLENVESPLVKTANTRQADP